MGTLLDQWAYLKLSQMVFTELLSLGKTLPVNTGVVPFATALAGGVLGGRAGAVVGCCITAWRFSRYSNRYGSGNIEAEDVDGMQIPMAVKIQLEWDT